MSIAKNKKLITSIVSAVFIVAVTFTAWPSKHISPAYLSNQPETSGQVKPVVAAFDKSRFPTDTASSLWVVVNKGRILPSGYTPAGLIAPNVALRLSSSSGEMLLRPEAASAMETMFAAAKSDSIDLMLASGYRSYSEQSAVYSSYVAQSGRPAADTYSARPGHSEHQTGLAADIEPASRSCEVDQCFADTPEGKWLAENCFRFGFIIRYQKDAQQLTGYEYEPWHVRFVGKELAAQIHTSGQTLEQFFGLPAINDYPNQPLQLKDS